MAIYDEGLAPQSGASRTGLLVNYAGAALSLALIMGVSFWGYKLIIRDVSGIPVVRAMEGDMRVLPDNPGGSIAVHAGLSVNAVAAEGEAAAPEDSVMLAPVMSGLAQEDIDAQPLAEAGEVTPADVANAEIAGDSLHRVAAEPATVKTLAQSQAPAEAVVTEEPVAIDAVVEAVVNRDVISASIPGLARSRRPSLRPVSLRVATPAAVATASEPAAATPVAVSTETFAAGTYLVQLGAYPSSDSAATEWDRLGDSFAQLMVGKERVIQVSNQSSGTWYRLRASGFGGKDDARRFCVALEAEGADCIAVAVN